MTVGSARSTANEIARVQRRALSTRESASNGRHTRVDRASITVRAGNLGVDATTSDCRIASISCAEVVVVAVLGVVDASRTLDTGGASTNAARVGAIASRAQASGTARAETTARSTTRSSRESLACDTNDLVLERGKSVEVTDGVDSGETWKNRRQSDNLRTIDVRADTNGNDGGTGVLQRIGIGNEVGAIAIRRTQAGST